MRTAPPAIAPTSAAFENPLVEPDADVDVAVELYLAAVPDLSRLDVQGRSESRNAHHLLNGRGLACAIDLSRLKTSAGKISGARRCEDACCSRIYTRPAKFNY